MFELNEEHKLSILAMFSLIFSRFLFPVPFRVNSSMTFLANLKSSLLKSSSLVVVKLFVKTSSKTSNSVALENVASNSSLFNLSFALFDAFLTSLFSCVMPGNVTNALDSLAFPIALENAAKVFDQFLVSTGTLSMRSMA